MSDFDGNMAFNGKWAFSVFLVKLAEIRDI